MSESETEGTVRRALRIAAEHRESPCPKCEDDGSCPDLDPVKGLLAPGDRSALTKVTVNLTQARVDALESACGRTRDTKTDTINRPLVAHELVLGLMESGGGSAPTSLGGRSETGRHRSTVIWR
ncbi:hypothetical protein OG792_14415 [Micromonospora sp. NBC_01699]|uniref:hypothetical protein n=1 Tax=Micromonospora sp. NBC_01699 TaxID=2975984 RepID=UPI002E305E78|nr:hypothetical protein [Micromonospora sp. NBC_01699]